MIAPPSADQILVLTSLVPTIERNLAATNGRGLVVVQLLAEKGQYKLGFTPAKALDSAQLIAMGVPEVDAPDVLGAVAEYDDLAEVPTLVTERGKDGKVVCSLITLDVRPLPTAGETETKH